MVKANSDIKKEDYLKIKSIKFSMIGMYGYGKNNGLRIMKRYI